MASQGADAFVQVYSHRAPHVFAKIDRGIKSTALIMSVLSAIAVLAAGAFSSGAASRAR